MIYAMIPFQWQTEKDEYEKGNAMRMLEDDDLNTIGIQLITHKSPQDPDAIFSPIFSNLLSISQSPDFALRQIAFSADD